MTRGILYSDLSKTIKFEYMNKRVFDDDFKRMAVDLSIQRGSVKEVADELGLNDSLLSKWRRRLSGSKQSSVSLNEDQI